MASNAPDLTMDLTDEPQKTMQPQPMETETDAKEDLKTVQNAGAVLQMSKLTADFYLYKDYAAIHDQELDDSLLFQHLEEQGVPYPKLMIIIMRGDKDSIKVRQVKEKVFVATNGKVDPESIIFLEEPIVDKSKAVVPDYDLIAPQQALVATQHTVALLCAMFQQTGAICLQVTAPCGFLLHHLAATLEAPEHPCHHLNMMLQIYSGTFNVVTPSQLDKQRDGKTAITTFEALEQLRNSISGPTRLVDYSRVANLSFMPNESKDEKERTKMPNVVPEKLRNFASFVADRAQELELKMPNLMHTIYQYNTVFNWNLVAVRKLFKDFSTGPKGKPESEEDQKKRLAKLARVKALELSDEYKTFAAQHKKISPDQLDQVCQYLEQVVAWLKPQDWDLVDPRKYSTLNPQQFKRDAPLADVTMAWFIKILLDLHHGKMPKIQVGIPAEIRLIPLQVQASAGWQLVTQDGFSFTALDDTKEVDLVEVLGAAEYVPKFLAIRINVPPQQDGDMIQALIKHFQDQTIAALLSLHDEIIDA